MTLKTRLLLTNLAMILSLLGAALASLWVVSVMAGSLTWVAGEYNELRLIDRANNDLAAVDVLLRSGQPDFSRVDARLDNVLSSMRNWLDLQGDDEYGLGDRVTAGHQDAEQRTASNIIQKIEPIVKRVAAYPQSEMDPADLAAVTGAIQRVRADLEALAAEGDQAVQDAYSRGSNALRGSILTLLGIGLIAVGVTLASGVCQYRSVMPPLARMRDRVREIASGRFDQRLADRGKDEFADLARDFNRMVAELEALYANLEQRVEVKSRQLVRSERLASAGYLAAGIAHEINNPLSIIAGHAELAIKDLRRKLRGAEDAESIQGLEIIRDEAFRCKQIIEKLLSLIRYPDAPRAVIGLGPLAHEVASLVRGIKQFNGRTLNVAIDPDTPLRVLAHEAEMKQVLLNLTINAMEAVADTTGGVTITGRQSEGWAEVSVIDNGQGMTPQALSRAFEPFYTEKRGSDVRGTGLGLSIVHAIIQDHGGSIEAHSDGPGHGCRFTLRLPAANAEKRHGRSDIHQPVS